MLRFGSRVLAVNIANLCEPFVWFRLKIREITFDLALSRAFVNLGQKVRKHGLNVDYRILIVLLDVNYALTIFDPVSSSSYSTMALLVWPWLPFWSRVSHAKIDSPSEFFSRAAELPKTNCKHGSGPAGHKCKYLIGWGCRFGHCDGGRVSFKHCSNAPTACQPRCFII
jgi:hypothetical protein